jgi:hypothetical protein
MLIANDISDMGAISSVNLLKNNIGVEQARALVIILKEHSTLKSLCGNTGDETELDMSDKMHGAERRGCYHACRGDHRQWGIIMPYRRQPVCGQKEVIQGNFYVQALWAA